MAAIYGLFTARTAPEKKITQPEPTIKVQKLNNIKNTFLKPNVKLFFLNLNSTGFRFRPDPDLRKNGRKGPRIKSNAVLTRDNHIAVS